ncbi:hypothetical protein CRUP_022116, partial [Coryphaenoides rupestris]
MCTKKPVPAVRPQPLPDGRKGEHEVKIMEDLIDSYLYVFDLSQAGDLIIEVYLEMKIPDCCITLKVSPTMCAEELTNQVLYMRNIPAGDKDVWMTFEAIEEGQLERPLHPKEKVLEQALQWCKMADPSSAYLVVKRTEIMKFGLLKCREEPPKLLQGNRFQERSFQIKDHKLLLLKDKKTMKIYMGIRRKLKAPSGYLCCSTQADLWDWVTSFLKAQNDDCCPPVLRRHSSSDISKQKFGTMPLPMKVQQDSVEERLESPSPLALPDLPEPLYEEVGDFGLQVLHSLETSFLSGRVSDTHEGPDLPLGLVLPSLKTCSL